MIFGVIDFLQKTNKQIRLHYYETSGRLVFVRFLEEINDPQKIFRNQLTFIHTRYWLWRFHDFHTYQIVCSVCTLLHSHFFTNLKKEWTHFLKTIFRHDFYIFSGWVTPVTITQTRECKCQENSCLGNRCNPSIFSLFHILFGNHLNPGSS